MRNMIICLKTVTFCLLTSVWMSCSNVVEDAHDFKALNRDADTGTRSGTLSISNKVISGPQTYSANSIILQNVNLKSTGVLELQITDQLTIYSPFVVFYGAQIHIE